MQYDSKWLNLTVLASDDQTGVTKVEIYVDGTLRATDTSTPYTFKMNTKPCGKGTHGINAKAYDGAGNSGISAPLTLTIN